MVKVKSIKRNNYKGKVYDIAVKDDFDYTVEDCVVHNSGAGSLVLYCLGVTQVDPVKYNLLFERFLDASRLEDIISKGGKVSGDDFPDVDVDYSNKDKVKQYLVEKYGKNFTCSIGTVGRMKNKGVLIDLSRQLNVDLMDVYEITKGEMKHFGEEEEKMDLDVLRNLAPALDNYLKKHPEIEKHFEKLRGTISFWGKHAGGVLVSNVSLTDQIPVRKVDDGNIASCWIEGMASRDLGRMGFLKMDILGVETISQIQETIDLIKEYRDVDLNMYDLPLEDDKAFALCNDKENIGVFQLDSYVAPGVIDAIDGAQRFEDYAIISALIRPSALQSRLHVKFGSRRRGEEQYELPECLKDTLGLTYGLPIYQESAYHVAKNLAGFSIVDAYKFMKLLYKGKMKADLIPAWREKFMKGCEEKMQNKEATRTYVENVFEELLKFQGYGFNESHAISYAMFSAWQLYLKAHYFPEFVCGFLRRTPRNAETKKGDNLLNVRIKYARQKGLQILPPNVNKSKEVFTIQDGGIRYGLSTIKGISKGAEEIVKNQPYKDIADFFKKVSATVVHKGRFESLLFAGAFDDFGDREEIYNWYFRVHLKKKEPENQVTFGFFDDMVKDEVEYKFFTKQELMEQEEEMLGLVFRESIVQKYAKEITDKKLNTIEEVKRKKMNYAKIIGRVSEIIHFKTFRTKADYTKVILTDNAYDAPLVMTRDLYDIKKKYFNIDTVLIVPVKVSADVAVSFYLDDRSPIEVITK